MNVLNDFSGWLISGFNCVSANPGNTLQYDNKFWFLWYSGERYCFERLFLWSTGALSTHSPSELESIGNDERLSGDSQAMAIHFYLPDNRLIIIPKACAKRNYGTYQTNLQRITWFAVSLRCLTIWTCYMRFPHLYFKWTAWKYIPPR